VRPALLVLVALVFAACGGDDDPPRADSAGSAARGEVLRFRSEPKLRAPAVRVRKRSPRAAPGSIFVAPRKGAGQAGPMIVDGRGELVWFRRLKGETTASDFKVQRYRGEPVLTWWQGRFSGGGGNGEYVILDSAYREVARVRAARGLQGDLHEFELTADGTALFFVYRTVDGVVDNLIQEVDVETGRLLFEWSALDHIRPRDSYREPNKPPWDYAHLNSIDVLPDGHLLVSARNTHAIYKIHRQTGRILWTLGGKASDFRMGRGTQFAWAHDARRQADGSITIFDNGAAPKVRERSRGLVLGVQGRRVTLRRQYTHPSGLLTHISAGMQRLPNGNVFLGWGATGHFSEHAPSGRMLFDARFTDPDNDTYRAYRVPWTGRPGGRPRIAARGANVYASWNGATEVRRWRVLAGDSPDALEPAGTGARRGFETAVEVGSREPYVAVEALGPGDEVLGTSRAIRR
jgi:Arylsulfotransferase (ASST)